MNKRGVELSINTIIVVILAVLVLVITIMIFTSAGKTFFADIMSKLKLAFGLLETTSLTSQGS